MAERFANNTPGTAFDRVFAARMGVPEGAYSTDLRLAWEVAQRYPNAGCACWIMEHAKNGTVPLWLAKAINDAHPGWSGANRIWRMKTWENVMPKAPIGAMATALKGR